MGQLDLMAAMLGHCRLGAGEDFDDFHTNPDAAWRPVSNVLERVEETGEIDPGLDRSALVGFLQDACIAVLRRCVGGELDLFSTSAPMRARLSMIFGAIVKS
ncbi:MAG: hypothetical protein ACLFQ5_00850 [Oceanicaulis sp.]